MSRPCFLHTLKLSNLLLLWCTRNMLCGKTSRKMTFKAIIGRLFYTNSLENRGSSIAWLYTLFEKSNFCPKIQFWQNPNFFTSFSPNFFSQFFSWNQSCQQLKSPIPQQFREFFTPKKIDNFLGKSKLNFWTKNEDFEQCGEKKWLSIFSPRKWIFAIIVIHTSQWCNSKPQ